MPTVVCSSWRKAMRTIIGGMLLGLLWVTTVAAQTPCQAPRPTTTVLNPTTLYAELTEHTLLLPDGSPSVTGYHYGHYAQGASAPTTEGAIAKSAWTLVSGVCYLTPPPDLGAVPIGAVYEIKLQALRGTEASPWSEGSNPFARIGGPLTPANLRLVRP